MRELSSRRPTRAGDAGFGLVEVMVACLVLGILAAAVVGIILQAQSASVTNRSRIAASNLAAREIDMVRDEFHRSSAAPMQIADAGTVVNPHPLDGQVAGQPLVIDGTPYTVTRSVQWNIMGNGQSACDGGSLVIYPTLGVTVSVTWPHMGLVKPVTSTTALAPDKGSGISGTDSFIAVKVSDQAGVPSAGRNVLVQGGSQSKTGTTDADGCAVVEVSPAAGTGTAYTAQVTDAGYVDISSTANPTKSVGTVSQGQLANNVTFQVALAGTVRIHLVDSAGNPVTAPPAGAQVTLDAKEYAGASSTQSYAATSSLVTIGGLWPTDYGAYYGTTPPAAGYAKQTLAPGGTIDLNAVLELGQTSITGLPAGTVVHVGPSGTASCSGTSVVGTVSGTDPLAVSLPPGDWTFFAEMPSAACSPGPTVSLVGGPNGATPWQFSTLTVQGAPAGSTVYAVEASRVTNSTSCPPAASTAPVTVPSTGVQVPAGTWYVYAVSGGSCATPTGQYPAAITYGNDYAIASGSHQVTVSITSIDPISSTGRWRTTYYWPTVYVSNTPVSGLTCSRSGVSYTAGGAALVPLPLNGSGTTWSATSVLPEGTWYVIGNDQNGAYGQTQWSNPTCKLAGTVTVGPYSGNLSINYTAN